MSPVPALSTIELLAKHHLLGEFDCRKHESLNQWLKKHALQSQQSESARTYVVHRDNKVVGYYSLCPGSVERAGTPERIAKGQREVIGIILLARLAVDHSEQGRGLGTALLKDALLRASQAADIISARAVLVHAIDPDAKAFYQHFGFEETPVDPLHLMMLMKDLRANFGTVPAEGSR